jgi:hypothetical protein
MKKRKMILIICILIFLVLFFPIKSMCKDGGTVSYKALTYKVTNYHRMNPYLESGFSTGLRIVILGKVVYNDYELIDSHDSY